MHKEIRTFKLARFKAVAVLDKCFIPDKNFEPHQHFGDAWSMIPEGKVYNIKVHFTAKMTKNVSEVHWHKSQKIEFQEDGSLIMTFKVDGINEISWWILGYGDQVKVISPAKLRKKIVKSAENMIEINK